MADTLYEMVASLREVGDLAWGRYAFKSEMLKGKIPPERRDEMVKNATACGEEWAERMIMQTGASGAEEMLGALGLELVENDLDMLKMPRQLFAQFVPDNRVEIMSQPLALYSELCEPGLPPAEQVRSLLIAHEMFHCIEDRYKDEIYTRTEKILLWKLFGFKWHSTVRTIGEIAAMSFAKRLARADFNPFMLDVVLLFGYNRPLAKDVFCSIVDIENDTITE